MDQAVNASRVQGSRPDYLAAAMFIGAGAVALWEGRELDVGSLSEMGSGYLPRVLSLLLIAVGAAIALIGVRRPRELLGHVRWRPVVAILLAVGGFAVLARPAGFVLASVWLVSVASLADADSRFREVAISSAVLTLFTTLLFVTALGVQIKLGPF